MAVRYFEIVESYGSQCNIWYIPCRNITSGDMNDLRLILEKTKNFRLGGVDLEYGKHFELPLNGTIYSDENTKFSMVNTPVLEDYVLERFIMLFEYGFKNHQDLDTEWENGAFNFMWDDDEDDSFENYKYDSF